MELDLLVFVRVLAASEGTGRSIWSIPLQKWVVSLGLPESRRDAAARLRLARCAGCDERVEGWHCGPRRDRVVVCSSCLRMAYAGIPCPLGRWQ